MANTQLDLIRNMADPLLTFRWVARAMPFGLPAHYVESIDPPFMNVQASEGVYMEGRYLKYPGTRMIQPFSLSIYEDRRGTGLAWINAWKERVVSRQGVYGMPSEYKRPIYVDQIDNKGRTVIETKLINCWPSDTAPIQLNYTDGTGRVIYQQTMEVEDREDILRAGLTLEIL